MENTPVIRNEDRKVWAAPQLERLTVDLDAIANTSTGGGDASKATHQS